MVDGGTLLCVTLGAEPGVATLEVTMNGVDWSADGRAFEFVAQRVASVSPAQGPADGGTSVVLSGANFRPNYGSGELWCQWTGRTFY